MDPSPAPPTPPAGPKPSLWLHIAGGVVGALLLLGIILVSSSGSLNDAVGTVAIGLLIGGGVGVQTARWCWWWAVCNPHPLLARGEPWLPLRGKWLVFGAAGLLF